MSVDLGSLYASSRLRITELLTAAAGDATDATAAIPCPATPGWCVHDVVAHLRGVAEDALARNLDGATTDPWTAAQVERHRDDSIATLLDDWAVDAEQFEAFLSGPHGESAALAVLDVHTHEVDILAALGRPAPMPEEFATWVLPMVSSRLLQSSVAAGLAPLRIVTDEGDKLGDQDAPVTLRVGRLEFFRGVTGRRSPAQVGTWDWGGADPAGYIEHLFLLGPRQDDLNE